MKKVLFTALLFGSQLSFSQSIMDGLLVYYKFDGNGLDDSGNGHHGIVNATLTTGRFGDANGAYHFNGIDEFIDLPNLSTLKPQLPISYSFWGKLDDLSATKTVFITNNFSQDNHSGVWMNGSGAGKLAINYGGAIGGSGSDNLRNKVGTTVLQTGVWYHFVGIVRSATDMELWINCQNDGGVYNGNGPSLNYTVEGGSIGRKDVATVDPYYYNGSMDEFLYWGRALTSSEVDILCNNKLSVEEILLVDDVKLAPNPANNFINVINHQDRFQKYSIFDLTGKEVVSGLFNNEINVSTLNSGAYIILLEGEKYNTKKRLIKH
jgi:hypothetical protein